MRHPLWSLFVSFLKIGSFTFGGGYAMVPLIQREVINRRHWLEEREFLDLLTIAQSAPGPIALNTSVFVGYKLRGYAGALSALLGIVLPAFSIILAVALFFSEIRENRFVEAAFKGMRPVVVALIVYPILTLSRGLNRLLYPIIILSAVAVWYLGWSPIWLLPVAALFGIVWKLWIIKRKGGSQ